ncbi:MAG TPA: YihA family ribosome biogenesis GTP-binding protein [Candidatus Pullichristensenella stercorigallinarum]|uniref:Probable GTP-binding protein EngB n=1 Tax=Candidatus Pullichristensenella stercorigallinarum TaxID=2840909 RepID=A0A9D0ZMW1_9FIRM|nr:YihA family ribosome biogenesis GTP-binding protein [Candidatus Pullichristensenella stercorigallinarum]
MTIRSAKFILSLDRLRPFPGQGLPEIAMAGKSNVGKSSMINSVLGNSKLARISSAPGKTRLINFFKVNDQFWLVDLPGYGFAKAPKAERDRWAAMIEGYLQGSEHLKRVLHLVDIRHEPTRDDQMMVEYLRHYDIPFTVVATKADKLSKAARGRSIPVICRTLAVQPWEVIPYSSEDGTGRERILELLETETTTGDDAHE